MNVWIVGPAEIDNRTGPAWDAARAVLKVLSPSDYLYHTGGNGIGACIDSIARRAVGVEKRRLPHIEVMLPEIGRYERERAFELNAAQLFHVKQCTALVMIGDGLDLECVQALAMRERAYATKVTIYSPEEFAAERAARG